MKLHRHSESNYIVALVLNCPTRVITTDNFDPKCLFVDAADSKTKGQHSIQGQKMISSERDQRQTHLIHLPAQLLGLIVLSWACADIRATACVTHEDLPITEPAVESRPLNMAPVLALDLDEVLGSFVSPLCDYHNEKYGTSLKVSDFHSYVFSQVCVEA